MERILYCPTSCPYLGKNGCKVACGNEEIECPVMAGVLDGEKTAEEKERRMAKNYNAGQITLHENRLFG